MATLLGWLFTHADLVLAANLAAGCYAAFAFVPELGEARWLRSVPLRLTAVVVCATFGILLLVCLVIGDALERRDHYYPPVPRGRG